MTVSLRILAAAAVLLPSLALAPLTSEAQVNQNPIRTPGSTAPPPKVKIAPPAPKPAAKAPAKPSGSGTGIVTATQSELTVYEKLMRERVTTTLGGSRFVVGKLAGRRVIATACGAGKINAAATAALLLQQFRPAEVLMSGPAGTMQAELEVGALLLVERAGFHDVGTTGPEGWQPRPVVDPASGQPFPLFFPADARLMNAAGAVAFELNRAAGPKNRAPKIVRGELLTGDTFCASDQKRTELLTTFRAQAVDTESAAVAQICWRENVPFLSIRGISYRVGNRAVEEHRRAAPAAASNAARFTVALVERLGAP